MDRVLSLAALTALPCAPPEMVRLAAHCGCQAVGLRLLPSGPGGVHYPLMDDAPLLRETLASIDDTGIRVLDLEVVRIGIGFEAEALLPLLEVGARLRAHHVLVVGDDPDEARLTDSFAALCDAARAFGLSADLEFMPWSAVPDARTAHRIAAAVGRDNAGVLVDAIHYARSGSTLADVAEIPRRLLHYAQICDADVPGPADLESIIRDARTERLPPGEGGIDLGALLAMLPPALPVSIEVPSDSRAPAMGYPAWARLTTAATQRVLAAAAAHRPRALR